MKQIPLTKGQLAMVDDEFYYRLVKLNWHAQQSGQTFYAKRTIFPNGIRTTVSMHRVILNITDPKIKIDHIDGNGLNNQKSNLRIASNQQNGFNRRVGVNNKLGVKGVTIEAGKYRAKIKINGKHFHIGTYKTVEEAAAAYNQRAIELFGQFANLNKLDAIKKRTLLVCRSS